MRGCRHDRQDEHREDTAAHGAEGERGARAARAPRGQAATLKATTAELDQAIDEVKAELDSLSEMGEMESLRLQMAMDRMSKLMSTLSNILRKASDTSGQITQNLK